MATIPTAPKTPPAPAAPAKPATPEITTKVIEKMQEVVTTTINEEGMKVYKSSCFSCHDVGIAGSPKIGDKAAWATRIATGLYASALSGKGVMPPKGGNMGLSDDAVKSAVDYMTAQAL